MQLTSRIDKVKLYAAGATVSRVAEFRTKEEQVEIPGLPLALDDHTVRVRVESDSRNSAIATDVRIGLAVPPHTQTLPFPDEAEIKIAQTEVTQLQELLTLIDNEIQFISKIKIPTRPNGDGEKAPPRSPTTMRMAIADYKKEQIRDRQKEKRDILEKLRHAQEHLEDLLQKKARASSSKKARPNELRKIAIICLSHQGIETTDRESPQRLILEYFVPGARWTPTYVCRLDTVANTATIAMRALICQRSGEDWSGVAIELSTAKPMMWCELPELPSLRLGRVQETPKKSGWRLPTQGVELLFEDYDRHQQLLTPTADTQTIAPPAGAALSFMGRGVSDEASDDGLDDLALESVEKEKSIEIAEEKNMGDRLFAKMRMPAEPSPKRMAAAPSLKSKVRTRRRKTESSVTLQQLLVQQQKINSLILAYNLMEISAPNNRDKRGKLSLMQQQKTYIEILRRQEVVVEFNIMSQLQEAISNAAQCLNLPLPSGGIDVREVAGSFDYAYRGEGRVDVPSDGEFHSVALTGQSTEMEIYYVTVPRVAANVFRMAKLHNPLKSPLLTGPTDVYLDDEYLLSTTINTVPPKAEMDLGLGVEESIKVARNTTYQENRGGNILVGVKELQHEIKIDLANNLGKKANIEVRDRLPIPAKDAKVDVIIDAVSPTWEKYKQTERDLPIQGGYHWWVDLPARKQKTLSVKYTLKIATDSDLVGGNRREE